MRLRPCLVHGSTVHHVIRPSVRKDRGPFLLRAATRVISNLFASSGAKVSRVGNSVLPLRGRVFPFFLEGEHHVYSKRSQCVSTDWRSARRPIRAATFDRADACHLRAAPRSEATRPKPSIGCTRSTLRPSLRT